MLTHPTLIIHTNAEITGDLETTCWMLDISDAANAPLIQGIPLVTGVDLLQQYPYVGIAGQLVCQTTGDPYAVPTYDNLGIDSKLYFIATP